MIFGDNGTVVRFRESARDNDLYSTFPAFGGIDTLFGGEGNDTIFGGSGGDDQATDQVPSGTVTVDSNGYLTRAGGLAANGDIIYGDVADSSIQGYDEFLFGDSGYMDRDLSGTILEVYSRSWALSLDGMVTLRADRASDVTASGTFEITLNGTTHSLTFDGSGNATLADLVIDLNNAILAASPAPGEGLDAELDASSESGYLTFVGASDLGVYTIEVVDSALVQALGFVQRQLASVDYPNLGGNDAIDFAVGNKGAEVIIGGFGHDLMHGGLFDTSTDLIIGDNGVATRIQGQFILAGARSTDAGSGGSDDINGGPGYDILLGGPGDDLIIGHDGDDYLWGDGGRDLIWGGVAGADESNFRLAEGESAADKFDYAPGYLDAELDYPTGYEAPLITPKIFNGLSWDGHVTDGADTIRGGYGDDWIFGGGDADDLDGGPGSDYVDGGVGSDTATGGGGDDVVRGGANDDSLRGDFPFLGRYDSISTYLKVGDTGTPAQPDEYFAYRGYVTGRDQVYGEAGSERLFGDGGASDPIVFTGDSVSALTAAKTENPDKGYPASVFSFAGANNDLEFRAVSATAQYMGWTIRIVSGEIGCDIEVSWSIGAKTFTVVVDKGAHNANDVIDAVVDTPSSPFLAYGTYNNGDSDYADGEGSQAGQRLWGGEGIDYLYAYAPDDGDEQYTYRGDELHGGPGNDFLYGNVRKDTLLGEGGSDFLAGDWLVGRKYAQNQREAPYGPAEIGGDDLLQGGPGEDQLYGGGGERYAVGRGGFRLAGRPERDRHVIWRRVDRHHGHGCP